MFCHQGTPSADNPMTENMNAKKNIVFRSSKGETYNNQPTTNN